MSGVLRPNSAAQKPPHNYQVSPIDIEDKGIFWDNDFRGFQRRLRVGFKFLSKVNHHAANIVYGYCMYSYFGL